MKIVKKRIKYPLSNDTVKRVITFGGGDNSTGLLCGWVERELPPPMAIVFSDTGGEMPHTYAHIESFSKWLVSKGMPPITVVRKEGDGRTLEEDCLIRGRLPAIAYGFKTCSQRFKAEPQHKWANNNQEIRNEWMTGRKVARVIGYDIDELGRARFYDDPRFVNEYPLINWRWNRQDCVDAINRAGLAAPGKSSCYFCPHMRKKEVVALKSRYPDLFDRAIKMETLAAPFQGRVKGLGRHWNWAEFLKNEEAVPDFESVEMPCGCYDGGEGM